MWELKAWILHFVDFLTDTRRRIRGYLTVFSSRFENANGRRNPWVYFSSSSLTSFSHSIEWEMSCCRMTGLLLYFPLVLMLFLCGTTSLSFFVEMKFAFLKCQLYSRITPLKKKAKTKDLFKNPWGYLQKMQNCFEGFMNLKAKERTSLQKPRSQSGSLM